MKTRSILLSGILMAAAAPAFAQATSGAQGMKMDQDMQGMPMNKNGSGMKMMMDCMQMHKVMKTDKNVSMGNGMQGMQMGKDMPCNQTAQGIGVIEAVDTTQGTVTIKHQAIASINWPAMTMTFKAEPPSLLQSVKVGENVNFTLHPAGMNSTVTAISAVR